MLARMLTRHPRRSANCGADVKAGSDGADVPQSTTTRKYKPTSAINGPHLTSIK
jgi:hypothetical protein